MGNLEGTALGIFLRGTKETALVGVLGENLGVNLRCKVWSNLRGNIGINLGESLGGNSVDINLIVDLSS